MKNKYKNSTKMKNSGQKLIVRIALTVIFMIGAYNSVFSQTVETPKLTKFLILVETTDDGIKLTGIQGCVFKELTFAIKKDYSQAVDQYGMSSLKRAETVKDSNFDNFLFTIKMTKEGLSFEGIIGTTWEKLSFSCPEHKCHQFIDQNGMTDEK